MIRKHENIPKRYNSHTIYWYMDIQSSQKYQELFKIKFQGDNTITLLVWQDCINETSTMKRCKNSGDWQ